MIKCTTVFRAPTCPADHIKSILGEIEFFNYELFLE